MKSISLKRHEIKRNHYMDVREWEVADRYLSVLNPNFLSLHFQENKKEGEESYGRECNIKS